jgi:pimeloyl-ACP methyl ester carboxylesterase
MRATHAGGVERVGARVTLSSRNDASARLRHGARANDSRSLCGDDHSTLRGSAPGRRRVAGTAAVARGAASCRRIETAPATGREVPSVDAPLSIEGVEVFVQGDGPKTLVMVHGWPDTYRLWDAQVADLAAHYRCVRFTLPGYEVGQSREAVSLARMVDLLAAVTDAVSPDRPVVLLLHDWGCFFGYQFAMRYAPRVAGVIGVDIGDSLSSDYPRSLTLKAKASILAYQTWLAAAWRLGGAMGDAMTRWTARLARAGATPSRIHAGMNDPYDILWTGSHGSYRSAVRFDPPCPMLFIYGTRKPFLFHTPRWATALAAREGCQVRAFDTGHWVMVQQPQQFNQAVREWLG